MLSSCFLSVGALNHKKYIFIFKVVAEEIIHEMHMGMDVDTAGPHTTPRVSSIRCSGARQLWGLLEALPSSCPRHLTLKVSPSVQWVPISQSKLPSVRDGCQWVGGQF